MSRIKNYADLEAEKLRLMALLHNHEEAIRGDVGQLQESLKPVGHFFGVLNKMATRDNRVPVMNFGIEMGIDLILRRFILGRAGWFVKIVIPYILKNYSSHFIGEERKELMMSKVRNILKKLSPKSKTVKTEVYRPQPAG